MISPRRMRQIMQFFRYNTKSSLRPKVGSEGSAEALIKRKRKEEDKFEAEKKVFGKLWGKKSI